jgi:hypothetical protein
MNNPKRSEKSRPPATPTTQSEDSLFVVAVLLKSLSVHDISLLIASENRRRADRNICTTGFGHFISRDPGRVYPARIDPSSMTTSELARWEDSLAGQIKRAISS